MKPVMLISLVFSAMTLMTTTALATSITWNIDVTVNIAPGGQGIGPVFTFNPTIPPAQTFSGTFTADDMNLGAIENLNLVVGGVDLATEYPVILENIFNPNVAILQYDAITSNCPPSCSRIGTSSTIAGNQFVAFDQMGILGSIADWDGFYTISKQTSTVPEPGALLLFGSGLAGLIGWQYRKKQTA